MFKGVLRLGLLGPITARNGIGIKRLNLSPSLFRQCTFQQQLRLNSEFRPSKKFQNSDQKNAELYKELYRKKERRKRNWIIFKRVFLGISTFAMVMIIWQPWNPYSKQVSRNLRKGLWSESEKEGKNYMIALKYYQKALDISNEEHMDQLDPKYTGIVLKIAEMYDNMEMRSEEREVYKKLSEFLYGKLTNGEVEEKWKDILLNRDLVVRTRLLELAEKDTIVDDKYELLDSMALCEERIKDKWPFLAQMGAKNGNMGSIEGMDIMEVLDLNSSRWSISAYMKRRRFVKKYCNEEGVKFFDNFLAKWPYFMQDLIRARDLFAMMEMTGKGSNLAIELLKSNLLWMQLSDYHPIYLGTAILNLGSAYYMKSERHEMHASQLKKLLEKEENEDKRLDLEMHYKHEEKEQMKALEMSGSIYGKLLDKMGGIEGVKAHKKDRQLQACLSMTLYSIGVVELHRMNYFESQRYFSQAKEVAADNELTQIVDKVDAETENMNARMKKQEIDEQMSKNNYIPATTYR